MSDPTPRPGFEEGVSAPVFLGKWTRREFREAMHHGRLKACILPIAAVEQHLEHLAMEHDWRSVCAVAEAVARRLGPGVLVAQGVMAGISEHHMKHPGTLTLSPGTFISVVNDLIDSVVRAGFTNVLVLNGHGGNVKPLEGIWDQYLRRFQVNLQFLSYWTVLTEDDAKAWLRGGHRMGADLPGHAEEFETAVALQCFPENVRTAVVSEQEGQSLALASAEAGAAFMDRLTERVSEHLAKMIRGESIAAIPPFFE